MKTSRSQLQKAIDAFYSQQPEKITEALRDLGLDPNAVLSQALLGEIRARKVEQRAPATTLEEELARLSGIPDPVGIWLQSPLAVMSPRVACALAWLATMPTSSGIDLGTRAVRRGDLAGEATKSLSHLVALAQPAVAAEKQRRAMEARDLEAEVAREMERPRVNLTKARAIVAGRHHVTPSALRSRIERGLKAELWSDHFKPK